MNDSKKLLIALLIGLVLGIVCILAFQAFNKDEELVDSIPNINANDNKPENVDYVIYIDSEASEKEINDVQEIIKSMNLEISSMTFKDKEEVKKELLESANEDQAKILNSYTPENNPLEHRILLSVKNVENKEDLKQKLAILVNVSNVEY